MVSIILFYKCGYHFLEDKINEILYKKSEIKNNNIKETNDNNYNKKNASKSNKKKKKILLDAWL